MQGADRNKDDGTVLVSRKKNFVGAATTSFLYTVKYPVSNKTEYKVDATWITAREEPGKRKRSPTCTNARSEPVQRKITDMYKQGKGKSKGKGKREGSCLILPDPKKNKENTGANSGSDSDERYMRLGSDAGGAGVAGGSESGSSSPSSSPPSPSLVHDEQFDRLRAAGAVPGEDNYTGSERAGTPLHVQTQDREVDY
jgi:hypothetical protein